MKPEEAWVIYNKYAREIIWVTAEHFLAQRKWDELTDESVVILEPVKNRNKLVVCTMRRALMEIAEEHKAEKEYLRTTYKNQQPEIWE